MSEVFLVTGDLKERNRTQNVQETGASLFDQLCPPLNEHLTSTIESIKASQEIKTLQDGLINKCLEIRRLERLLSLVFMTLPTTSAPESITTRPLQETNIIELPQAPVARPFLPLKFVKEIASYRSDEETKHLITDLFSKLNLESLRDISMLVEGIHGSLSRMAERHIDDRSPFTFWGSQGRIIDDFIGELITKARAPESSGHAGRSLGRTSSFEIDARIPYIRKTLTHLQNSVHTVACALSKELGEQTFGVRNYRTVVEVGLELKEKTSTKLSSKKAMVFFTLPKEETLLRYAHLGHMDLGELAVKMLEAHLLEKGGTVEELKEKLQTTGGLDLSEFRQTLDRQQAEGTYTKCEELRSQLSAVQCLFRTRPIEKDPSNPLSEWVFRVKSIKSIVETVSKKICEIDFGSSSKEKSKDRAQKDLSKVLRESGIFDLLGGSGICQAYTPSGELDLTPHANDNLVRQVFPQIEAFSPSFAGGLLQDMVIVSCKNQIDTPKPSGFRARKYVAILTPEVLSRLNLPYGGPIVFELQLKPGDVAIAEKLPESPIYHDSHRDETRKELEHYAASNPRAAEVIDYIFQLDPNYAYSSRRLTAKAKEAVPSRP